MAGQKDPVLGGQRAAAAEDLIFLHSQFGQLGSVGVMAAIWLSSSCAPPRRQRSGRPKEQAAPEVLLSFRFPPACVELQQLDEGGAELTAGYDLVYKAVFQLELAALEALGQALADGLLDDAGACKTDECARLSQHDVAKAGKAGGNAAGSGWVNTLMYSPPLAEKRSMAALVLAICIRLKMPPASGRRRWPKR